MFRKSILLVGIFISCQFSQAQWYNLVTGTTQNLFGVQFKDSLNGFVVGGSLEKSTILQTNNGGTTWQIKEFTNSKYLYDIQYIDSASIIACGHSGIIYKSTDGGNSWSLKPSTTTEWLYSIHFTNAMVGYAVGTKGILLKTTNGGNNWEEKNSGTNVLLLDVSFANDTLGIAVGKTGRIIKTTNGGDTWKNINSPYLETLHSVFWFNKDTVWAVGENGRVIYSMNEGEDWTSINLQSEVDFQSVFFVNDKAGYIISKNSIHRTEDAGLNWVQENSPILTDLHRVSMIGKDAFIVGKDGAVLKNTKIPLNIVENNEKKIKIFPNPARSYFQIQTENTEKMDVVLWSIDGKKVAAFNALAANSFISTEGIPDGIYLCSVQTENNSFSVKIIITK